MGQHGSARALLVIAIALASGCRPATTKTASQWLDDVVRVFPESSMDDIARGRTGSIDDVLRQNADLVDDAFQASEFANAVAAADTTASRDLQVFIANRFGSIDDFLERRIETTMRRMVCELTLYVRNPTGDIEIFRPWIEEQFAQIDVPIDAPVVEAIALKLEEWVNDKTSTYSLACLAWQRTGR